MISETADPLIWGSAEIVSLLKINNNTTLLDSLLRDAEIIWNTTRDNNKARLRARIWRSLKEAMKQRRAFKRST